MKPDRVLCRLVALIPALLFVCACSRGPSLPPPDQVHVVRGRIVQLPEPGKPAHSLQIHHEPIDHYVAPNGRVGMGSMTMPFVPAKDLSLDGLALGDIVEFRWEVRKRENGPSLITTITRLPPDTVLNLGRSRSGG